MLFVIIAFLITAYLGCFNVGFIKTSRLDHVTNYLYLNYLEVDFSVFPPPR